jgi:hypothetical protein
LAAKGRIKGVENSSNMVRKNISFSSAYVNFPSNMSYTPTLGSKGVHNIFSMWGPKMSNNTNKSKSKLIKNNLTCPDLFFIICSKKNTTFILLLSP